MSNAPAKPAPPDQARSASAPSTPPAPCWCRPRPARARPTCSRAAFCACLPRSMSPARSSPSPLPTPPPPRCATAFSASLKSRTGQSVRPQPMNSPWALARRALEHSQALGWNLLDLPAQLRISTIDSFCRDLALQQPLLSGLGGGLDIAEQPDELYRRAARQHPGADRQQTIRPERGN